MPVTTVGPQNSISGSGAGNVPANLFVRPYIDDWMVKLRRSDIPFTKLVKVGKAPRVPAVKREFGWGSLTPDQDTLGGGGINNSVTAITVGNISMWQVGDKFRIDAENFYVTALPGGSVLTVATRPFGGSAASHTANATIIKLGPAIMENQDTPLSPITQGDTDFNYFEQVEYSIQMSHRRQVIPTYETMALNLTDAEKAEMRKKMEQEAPIYMENTLLFGSRNLGTATAPSTMGGILTTPTFVTTQNTSLGGVPLTEFTLMDNIQTVYNLVGQDKLGTTLMAHPFVLRAISSWYNSTRRTGPRDDRIKLQFTQLDTWFGVLNLYPNYKMVKSSVAGPVPLDQLLVFNPDDMSRLPLSGDSGWHLDPLPENGWYTKAALRGDWTLEAQNPDSRLILGGFSMNAGDYPGIA